MDHESPARINEVGHSLRVVTRDTNWLAPLKCSNSFFETIGVDHGKSHHFTTGQCPVMKYHRELMNCILYDKVQIAKATNVTVISLDDAPQGYRDFDNGAARKFVIDPHSMIPN